ncbi:MULTISPECIES: nitrous oxide reductase accessory protein NosL [unclassified Haloferax]|uniref:nitrous oxide reductase accessory protein NosL n=1 Tax=unclassified Haloferax TaxID=2625095 RepID=UPI0002B2357F|nr:MULTISPECIES: nitrous oxide reductase accessory protein NosL [unclassified Haloferax]ELZ59256.1 NosL family protein [Haloferax sp. ATCC BAA-646]ELZ59977.1 NosL family protein [Haloferax sp. ATCC BAA-645]ELZ72127.1 NosL family protein [Haloferax sp. ATCC BAA-644]
MCNHCDRELARRTVLSAVGVAGVAATAGCLGGLGTDGGGDAPEAVALTGGEQCDACGMVIDQHPGPAGQLFYADHSPEGHDNPARFCSAWETFSYALDREDDGWNRAGGYLTDYSAVEYDLFDDGGRTLISAHLDADAFAPMDDLVYVVGTDVNGSMGPDFVPFSDDGDAEAFADAHDGAVYERADISRDLIARR